MKKLQVLIPVLLAFSTLFGTTITPYTSWESLSSAAENIMYVRAVDTNVVTVMIAIKGIPPTKDITVRKYTLENAIIWGEIDLISGEEYLLFLNNYYKPICLSYYIYKFQGEFLIPTHEKSYITTTTNDPNANAAYHKDTLLNYLQNLQKNIQDAAPEPAYMMVVEPSHCTHLMAGGNPMRREYPTGILMYTEETEMGCSTWETSVHEMFDEINTDFEGVSYINGGLTNFVADCADLSAIGSDFRDYIDDTLNTVYGGIIIFSDPCEEISDLVGCSGILAIGGAYGIGSHTFNDSTWTSAVYPFVIFNNIASCACSNYRLIAKHEVGHTLGLGHINPSNGSALMNPSCCNEVTSLDTDCMNFTYPCTDATNTWIGDVSDDWTNPANWSLGLVPQKCHDIVVPKFKEVQLYQGDPGVGKTLDFDSISTMEIHAILSIEN